MNTLRPRQEPGLACQECRRKKLRCDRKMPCGACVESGVRCHINTDRPTRGPKRGHLKELRSRLAVLESRLRVRDDDSGEIASDLNGDDNEGEQQLAMDEGDIDLPKDSFAIFPEIAPNIMQFPDEFRAGTTSGTISKLTRADLNQVYFDRVHPFIPILQQGRYFAWAKQTSPSRSYTCLNYAVWTIAASLSSQFQFMQDGLYHDARQMLETLEGEDNRKEDPCYLQQAQAWIILAVYEFMRKTFRRTWTTTGRALRLVQMMKLNEIDSIGHLLDVSSDFFASDAETEEKRRTFWMAYCLDRFCCVLNNLPLTVDEDTIYTRLPSAETDFQSGNLVLAPFLSDVMRVTDLTMLTPFSECIIFTTLWGRVLSHQKQSSLEQACGSPVTEFWDRHSWLDSLLMQRIQMHQDMPCREWMDPMLLFTRMMAQVTVLSLAKAPQPISWGTPDYGDILAQCKQKSSTAAQEIARLSQYLTQLNFLKIHPFISIPLFLGGEFIVDERGADVTFNGDFLEIIEALRELKSTNLLCQVGLELVNTAISNRLQNGEGAR